MSKLTITPGKIRSTVVACYAVEGAEPLTDTYGGRSVFPRSLEIFVVSGAFSFVHVDGPRVLKGGKPSANYSRITIGKTQVDEAPVWLQELTRRAEAAAR